MREQLLTGAGDVSTIEAQQVRAGITAGVKVPGEPTLDPLKALRDAGLVEWVEVHLPRLVEPPGGELRDRLRRAVDQLGMAVSLHSETTTFAAHRNGAVRAALAKTLVRTIALAREVGAGVVVIHPPIAAPARIGSMSGGRWTARERNLLQAVTGDPTEAAEWFTDFLASAASAAERSGVVLALENMRVRGDDPSLNHPDEVARMVEAVDSRGVGICLDIRKAANAGVDPACYLRAHAPRIVDAHVAGIGRRGRPAAIGEGPIDWPSVAEAFREMGYHGPAIYEGPLADAEPSLRALRDLGVTRRAPTGGMGEP